MADDVERAMEQIAEAMDCDCHYRKPDARPCVNCRAREVVEKALAEARAILERASTADYQDPNEWLADALAWLRK